MKSEQEKRKGPITAGELGEIHAKDPEFQAMMREKEAKWAAFEAELTKDESSLINELRVMGIMVDSVYDLVNSRASYPAAMPILIKHLRMKHHPRIKEGIIRALIDPASVIGFQEIYEEFCNTPALSEAEDPTHFKWLIGAALAEASRVDTLPIILELLRDKRNGDGRNSLIYALKRLPKKKRDVMLRDLAKDQELAEIIKKEKFKFSPE